MSALALMTACGTYEPPAPGEATDTAGSADTAPADDSGCTPAAEVVNDGVDQDCDGHDAVDRDRDGYLSETASGGTDCDDGDAMVHPGAAEACDEVDQDCDGVVDEDATPAGYRDRDGDGYGNPRDPSCVDAIDLVADATDCNDTDPSVHPGADEVCDGRDDDCDGVAAEGDLDRDGDGVAVCAGDCDDAEPRVAPGNPELCGDGLDNDCEGTADEACVDDHCDLTVPTDQPNIQGAIEAATEGSTICVEPGTYPESLDFLGKAVAVVGLAGSAMTLLTPLDPDVPSVQMTSGEARGAVLAGVTVSGGPSMWFEDSAPTLVDVVIEDLWWNWWPGAIHADHAAPAFWGVRVLRGRADYDVKEYGNGGGMDLHWSQSVLDDVLIEDCFAGSSGGGVAVWGGSVGLSNVIIRRNLVGASWGDGGGGLSVSGSRVSLTNVLIVDNAARMGWDHAPGGGVRASASTLTFENVTLCGNETPDWGGGLLLEGSVVTLRNTVICSNTSSSGGGGIEADSTSSVMATYGDLWGNQPVELDGVTDPTGTVGNLSVDPEFADATYQLSASSPLVDAGDPTLADADGSVSDIGAWGGPRGQRWRMSLEE